MKAKIGKRVTITKTGNSTRIEISGKTEEWMQHVLAAWVILWSSLGLYVVYYLLAGNVNDEQFWYFAAYLAFWVYFEVKGLEAFFYKWKGYELLEIDKENVILTKSILGLGKRRQFVNKDIKNIRIASPNRKSVWAGFDKSFWVVGNQQILFDFPGGTAKVGIHLERKDTNLLLRKLKQLIRSGN